MPVDSSISAENLALFGGNPIARFRDFPRDKVIVPVEAGTKIAEVIQSGNWSMFTSDEVTRFEREFADVVGARHVVLVNSCTTAIHATLSAYGVKPESIVAVPAFTYVGTCLPALALGSKLVLVDIDPETQSMNLESLENTLKKYPVSAVVHAHLFGKSWNAEEAFRITNKYGAHYVSDTAQLLGIPQETSKLALLGPCCFSFGDSKLLRLGEGGAVACNNEDFAETIRKFRHEGEAWLRLGKSRVEGFSPTPRDVISNLATIAPGLNYRPVATIAALGRIMLQDFPNFLASTHANAMALVTGLSNLKGLTPPSIERRSWWTFPATLDPQMYDRDTILACLLAEGVPAGVHFPRMISEHPFIAQYIANKNDQMQGAESFARSHFVLPIYPALDAGHMEKIAIAVKKVLGLVSGNSIALREAASNFLNTREVDSLSSGLFFFLRE